MENDPSQVAQTWRTTHGDMSDEEWELIADLVAPYWTPGSMGRPVTVDRRARRRRHLLCGRDRLSVASTARDYPNWNSVHRQHLEWSRNGTWEQIAARLAAAVRVKEGRDAEPSAGIVDARSVRAGATVSKETKGYDAGKRINGRKTFGIVDTLGLLMAVVVVAASTSDNTGGMSVSDRARERSARFAKLWCDSGFKRTFIEHCRNHHIGVEVVKRIHPGFKALPKRWIVERTWAWLMNSRRLQVDYERDPVVTEGFIWAAHSRYLLRRLTQPRTT